MGLTVGNSNPGLFHYSSYYPMSGINYWSNANTSFGDFTVVGSIPAPTVIVNSNFGTVTKATSDLPGLNVAAAPRTGTIRVTCIISYIPGLQAAANNWALKCRESVTSTDIAFTAGGITTNSVVNEMTTATLVGYFSATVGTAYNFKLQSLTQAGTFYVGGYAVSNTSQLQINLEYIT